MPISPQYGTVVQIKCRHCGWSITIPQRSDVVVAPSVCKACGSEDLEKTRTQNPLQYLAATLKQAMKFS